MTPLIAAIGYTLAYSAILHGLFSIAFQLDAEHMRTRPVLAGAVEAAGGLAGSGVLLAITGGFL